MDHLWRRALALELLRLWRQRRPMRRAGRRRASGRWPS